MFDSATPPPAATFVGGEIARLPTLIRQHPRTATTTLAVIVVYAITLAIFGGVGASIVGLLATAIVGAAAWRMSQWPDRPMVVGLSLSLLVGRILLAAILDAVLNAAGKSGALFNDDLGYLMLAKALGANWRGEPGALTTQAGLENDPSINTLYVQVAGGLFALVGPSSLALKALNTCLGVLAAVLVYRTMCNHRFPGARTGLFLMLCFPSIVLWAALALKDTYVLFFLTASIWAISEFLRTHRYSWYAVFLFSLLAIENVRTYLFVVLAIAWPIAVAIGAPSRSKRRATAFAFLGCLSLLSLTPALSYIDPRILSAPAIIRAAMQRDARTGFGEGSASLRLDTGDWFVVTAPGVTPTAAAHPRIVEVPLGAAIVVQVTPGPAPANAIVTEPGDIVVVRPSATPGASGVGPTLQPSVDPASIPSNLPVIALQADKAQYVEPRMSSDAPSISGGIRENLAHLPLGALYVVGAPFPLAARTLSDVMTIPEMLLWYLVLAFATVGLAILVRRRQFDYAFGVLVLAFVFLVLSLVEGNTGTLFRHRAMLIPLVVIPAGIGMYSIIAFARRRPLNLWRRRAS
jgi:hypothetical protein